jgi:hypothetical protein
MNISLAMLVFNRPIHAGLSLGFAIANKHVDTDLHVFYSIHRSTKPPSYSMDQLLRVLTNESFIQYHYLNDDKPQSCGGNVDTLMTTMCSDGRYDCFMKIDDDVIIGEGTDVEMGRLLLELEPHKVMFLMGQSVKQHMRMSRPFAWEVNHDGYRIVQRARKACPMETYTAVNPKVMEVFHQHEKSTLCEDNKGTFMPYTRKVTAAGYKAGLVLAPAITMQHIGLTSTIDNGAARNWAPATAWDNPSVAIDVPHFNFDAWEASHTTRTQQEFAIKTLTDLKESLTNKQRQRGVQLVIDVVEAYKPGENDVALPDKRETPQGKNKIIRRNAGHKRVNAQGTLVRRPRPAKRVIVRQKAKVRR